MKDHLFQHWQKISIPCPNIATFYLYAKNLTYYSNVYNSTSALTELGSVIGIQIRLNFIYREPSLILLLGLNEMLKVSRIPYPPFVIVLMRVLCK